MLFFLSRVTAYSKDYSLESLNHLVEQYLFLPTTLNLKKLLEIY